MVSSLPPRIERNRGNRAIRAISFRLHSRKRNNRIREGRRRDSTDGRTTYIHLSPHYTPLTTAKGFGIALWGSHSPSPTARLSGLPVSLPSLLCPKSPILLASRSIKESYGSPLSIVVRFIPCHVRPRPRRQHQSEEGGRTG